VARTNSGGTSWRVATAVTAVCRRIERSCCMHARLHQQSTDTLAVHACMLLQVLSAAIATGFLVWGLKLTLRCVRASCTPWPLAMVVSGTHACAQHRHGLTLAGGTRGHQAHALHGSGHCRQPAAGCCLTTKATLAHGHRLPLMLAPAPRPPLLPITQLHGPLPRGAQRGACDGAVRQQLQQQQQHSLVPPSSDVPTAASCHTTGPCGCPPAHTPQHTHTHTHTYTHTHTP
jgi:hypothetical protein